MSRLTDARRAVGLSQEALAEAVGVSPKSVGRWERGEAAPYDRQRPALAQALQVDLGTLDVILDDRSTPRPPALGPLDLDPATEATAGAQAAMDAFRIADRAGAGPDLYVEAAGFAERYASRLVAAGGTTGPILVAVAGLTELVGWLAHDAGPGDALASQHFTRARDLAVAGGDPQLAAHAGASLAHLLNRHGHGLEALDAADRALIDLGRHARPGAVDAQVEAMRARALALVGRPVEARAALTTAASHLQRDEEATRSPWIHSFDVASLAAEAARALAHLADHRGAVEEALVIVEHRTPGSRAWALAAVRRAVSLAALGEIDEAAGVGVNVALAPWASRSTALGYALDELEAILTPHATATAVREFIHLRRN